MVNKILVSEITVLSDSGVPLAGITKGGTVYAQNFVNSPTSTGAVTSVGGLVGAVVVAGDNVTATVNATSGTIVVSGLYVGDNVTATVGSGTVKGIYAGDGITASVISGTVKGLYAGDGITTTVSGGTVKGTYVGDGITASVSSGTVKGLYVGDSITASVSSGTVKGLYVGDGITTNVSSGIVKGIYVGDSITASVSGGTVKGLYVGDNVTATVGGGTVKGIYSAGNGIGISSGIISAVLNGNSLLNGGSGLSLNLGNPNNWTAYQAFTHALSSGIKGGANGEIDFIGLTSGSIVALTSSYTTSSWTMVLPVNQGTSGYLLQTDGAGVTSWFNLFGTANTWTALQVLSNGNSAVLDCISTTSAGLNIGGPYWRWFNDSIWEFTMQMNVATANAASSSDYWYIGVQAGSYSKIKLFYDGSVHIDGLTTFASGITGTGNTGALLAGTGIVNTVNTWGAIQVFANNTGVAFTDTSGHTNTRFVMQSDNNFVLYGGNSLGTSLGICSVLMNQAGLQPFVFGTGISGVVPGADNSLVFGTLANRWKDIEAVTATFGGAVNVSGSVTLGAASVGNGTVKFVGTTSGTVTVQCAATAGAWALTLPSGAGVGGYLLQTDGAGVTSWFNLFGTVNTWTVRQTMANGVSLNFADTSGHTNPEFVLQADNNFVFYGSNSTGGNLAIFSCLMNQATVQDFVFWTGVNGVRPAGDNALILGHPSFRWKDFQAITATFGGSVTITGVLTLSSTPKFSTGSTGTGTASLGANCPAVTPTAPYTWITVTAYDGSTGYVPIWK